MAALYQKRPLIAILLVSYDKHKLNGTPFHINVHK